MPSKKLILRTYLTPEELGEIRASAAKAGLSLSTFSKRVCLGYTVPSLEHQEARLELRRLKGDLRQQRHYILIRVAVDRIPPSKIPPQVSPTNRTD